MTKTLPTCYSAFTVDLLCKRWWASSSLSSAITPLLTGSPTSSSSSCQLHLSSPTIFFISMIGGFCHRLWFASSVTDWLFCCHGYTILSLGSFIFIVSWSVCRRLVSSPPRLCNFITLDWYHYLHYHQYFCHLWWAIFSLYWLSCLYANCVSYHQWTIVTTCSGAY